MKMLPVYVLLCGAMAGCSSAGSKIVNQKAEPATAAMAVDNAVPVFSPMHPVTGSDETIFGDPKVPGRPFVIRVRELPGTVVPPHTHHFDENITIVQGTWYFGIGAKFDRSALHELPTGSFVSVPKNTPMFGYAPKAVTVQIHGIGPFDQHFVDTLYVLVPHVDADEDTPVDAARFRFHPGQLVNSPHGKGHIRQGYAIGTLVEYQVAGSDGQVSMILEEELK